MRFFGRFLVVAISAVGGISAAQEIQRPWSWEVSSDFGPRNVGTVQSPVFDFHEGVDYNAALGDLDLGTPIPAVESGNIIRIAQGRGQFWAIEINGIVTGDEWLYGHIFRITQTTIDDWELRFNTVHINAFDPNVRQTATVIIKSSGGGPVKILSTIPDYFIDDGTGDVIRNAAGEAILTRRFVDALEQIAPMGDALSVKVPVHLHLSLNYPGDNPLFRLQHAPDPLPAASIISPQNNKNFQSSDLASPVRFETNINTVGAYDLDKVTFWLYRDNLPALKMGMPGQPTFNYGGRPGEVLSAESNRLPSASQSGVAPQGATPGSDNFVFFQDLNILSEGQYTFLVKCKDVNDHEACDGEDAKVQFSVIKPFPKISVSGAVGFIFDRLQGIATYIPSTLGPHSTIIIEDDIGIQSITIPGGGAFTPGAKNLIFQLNELGPGTYPFSATNLAGKKTEGSFRVVDLGMIVQDTSVIYNEVSEAFSTNATIRVDSSLAIAGIDVLNANNSQPLARYTVGPTIPIAVPGGSSTSSFYMAVRDIEINTASQGLVIKGSSFGIPPVDAAPGAPRVELFVVGTGEDSESVPLVLNNSVPGFSGVINPGVVHLTPSNIAAFQLVVGTTESPTFTGPVPVVPKTEIGTYQLTVNGGVLVSGVISTSGNAQTISGSPVSVSGAGNFVLSLVADSGGGVDSSYCLEFEVLPDGRIMCTRPLVPMVSVQPFVTAMTYSLSPPAPGPNRITVYEGGGQSFSLTNGVSIAGFTATAQGSIERAGLRTALVDPGYTNLMGTQVHEITASEPAFYAPQFTVTLPVDESKHTPLRQTYIARILPCKMELKETTIIDGTVTAQVNGFGKYAIVESKYPSPAEVIQGDGNCSFVSNEQAAPVTVAATESSPRVNQAINVHSSFGKALLGSTCRIGPTGAEFNPAGVVKICFDPETLAQANATVDDIDLFQFDTQGLRQELPDLSVDFQRGIVSASVNNLSSIFGVFVATPAVPASDLLPPITSLLLDGMAAPTSAYFVTTTTSALSLSATDPSFPGAPVSGVASTRILIDTPFVDTTTTPGQIYSGAFSFSPGEHTVTYYSVDAAGNVETPVSVSVLTNLPPTRGVGGLGIGRDSSNRLWTVALDGESVAIARTNDDGIAVASASLPNALSDVQWGVLFDDSGSAYAVGTAEGPTATDLAIYKASMDGDSIVASQYFDSGFANNDFVFDVAAPGWIAGGVQVSGPADFDSPGERVFKAALWRFNPADGVVTLSTAFAQGAALGVAVDGDGSVWVAGFVENPSPRSSRVLDLGLWHFASDGQTVLAGPFLREAYAEELIPNFATKILVSASAISVVAPRGRPGAGTDLGSVLFDKSNGAVLAESAWRAADGSGAYPAAVLGEGSGALAAGGLDAGDTRGALWRYGADGSFTAASLVASGGARGAVVRSSELWLAVDNATTPYKVTTESASPGALTDIQPPRVDLAATSPSFVSGNTVFVTSTCLLSFTSIDDKLVVGDGLGAGGGGVQFVVDSTGPFAAFSTPFAIAAEGLHSATFYGGDGADNPGPILTRSIGVDMTEPAAMLVSSGSLYAIEAEDPVIGGTASGVAQIQYLIDADPETCVEGQSSTAAAPGTCANPLYAGPFSLSAGTHTVYFAAPDNLGNGSETIHSSYVVVGGGEAPPVAVVPTSGPIGVPFTITGSGFGAYGGSNTRVRFGASTSPISVWNDATIVGTIPGLSTGAHAVEIERQHASSMTSISAGVFTVTGLGPQSISISSGPIGIPFSITGSGFGPYNGTMSRVMIGGTTAPLSLWNDTAIAGTIPGVPAGETVIYLVRTTSDGGISQSEPAPFTVTVPSVAVISPSSGPIGAAFALSGESFGPYGGALTVVLIGGATAPVSIWNDTAIAGTIPGALLPGVHPVIVERRTSDGGLARAATAYFEVTGLGVASLNPSTGPIGVPFSIQGAGFGAYGGANTRVKFGDTVASVSLWNNTTINGTVPPLSTGTWTVVVERQQGSGVSQSNISSFTLTALEIATLTPSSGSIGAPFSITGTGYGPYAGTNSRVLIGGATAALSVWNDSTITGTIPALPAGPHAVRLERVSGAGLQVSAEAEILVVDPAIAATTPSSGPIGIAFTVTGAGFGPYGGANTVLLIGGSTAPVSLWNDTTIKGTVPGSLPTGLKSVVVKRIATGGSSTSNPAEFQVTGMSLNAVNPSSGSIGAPFTITGTQFGAYGGSNTRVRMGGVVTGVSVWNDTTITGTIPNLTPGVVDLVVERQQGAITALSNFSSFTVVGLSPTGLTPETGPIGTAFTLTGSGFGPYGGSNTRVLVAGLIASVSLWNDTTIKGTIPAAAAGSQPMWIERQLGAAVQSSDTAYFNITVPSVASLTPSSAPIGAPFTLTGTSFGVYGGANTRVKFNGVVAPVSVWNDTTIAGTVPGVLAPGEVELVVERAVGSGLSSSATQAFLVLLPTVSTITPGYGPAGTVVTLTGTGFGPYGGTLTKVLVGGATTAVSVWNDKTIRWTVPASLSDGEYPVIVRRSPAGGTADSEPVNFTVGTGYGTSSFGFAQTMSLASTPDSHFEGDLALSSTTGGRIDTPAKAAVEIPPNAMEEDTSITVKRAHSDGLRNNAAENILKRAAGEPIEFGPEGTRFATPVTIELPYDPALISDETKIAIHYFNPLRREWEELASVVDRARKVVSAKTDHFSIYQPMGLAPTAASQDEFYFRDAYAFPNPSRGGALVTFRIQPGLAETIELRVYDLSGRKVHDSTDFTFRGAFDDGNGKGAQNTYDHTWGVSGVGSGVYTFVMKASQRGNKPIVKSGKVGVIK